MKIISNGIVNKLRFTCSFCKCVFETDETDRPKLTTICGDPYKVTMNCPYCGNEVDYIFEGEENNDKA